MWSILAVPSLQAWAKAAAATLRYNGGEEHCSVSDESCTAHKAQASDEVDGQSDHIR